MMLDGAEVPLRPNIGIFTQPISFIGLPVVAVPVPLAPLPIGVQIIAAPWREDVALRIAHALEKSKVVAGAPASRVGRRSMEIDLPEVVAEVREAFERYEKALVTNDVATLDAMFRKDERTIRYGVAENLYGHSEVAAFRAGRSPINLMRTRSRTVITTYGRDFAVASTLFHRDSCPARSAGRCRPGCAFRRAGGWSPRTSASSRRPRA